MNKLVNKASSLSVPKHIEIKMLGRKQRLTVTNGNTGDPINPTPTPQNKRKEQSITMNNKAFGIVYLIVKVSFLIAGITLWKMSAVHFIIDIPFYQMIGSIVLAVLIYLELEPHFGKVKKSKKSAEPKTNLRPSNFIEQ